MNICEAFSLTADECEDWEYPSADLISEWNKCLNEDEYDESESESDELDTGNMILPGLTLASRACAESEYKKFNHFVCCMETVPVWLKKSHHHVQGLRDSSTDDLLPQLEFAVVSMYYFIIFTF
jgi:hypothetical protein